MTTEAVFIKKIWQLDSAQFAISWTDGSERSYRLADLQRNCPCAACQELSPDQRTVKEDVSARAIRSVGRYALRIDFTSGCSNGIFNYDRLYALGNPLNQECCS